MNIDENEIEKSNNVKDKSYCSSSLCWNFTRYGQNNENSKKHNLKVVEDAAQGFMAKYKEKYLGTIGDLGCYSFHETKKL